MKKRILLSICVILGCGSFVFAQNKTVTNADLEKYRQKRLQAEKDLEERYKELGFPSPTEIRQKNEQDEREREALSQQLRYEKEQKQGDFVARANALRSQIASVEAQINYLASFNSAYQPQNNTFYSVGVFPGYGYGNRRPNNRNNGQIRVPVAPVVKNGAVIRQAPPPPPQRLLPIQTFPPAQINQYQPNYNGQRRGNNNGYGGNNGYYAPVVPYYNNNGVSDAGAQLLYLQQVYAGLLVQWSALEDEARRAGVRLD